MTHKNLLVLAIATLLSLPKAFTQILSTSNLPIVIIDTQGENIDDEPKIQALFGIIDNGPGMTNNINDPFNAYDGHCGIEVRGNSTQGFDKLSYGLELWTSGGQDTSASLLGMGKEEDWILHAMVLDKTQVRIPMTFYFSQRMGHYASDWRYVELVINGAYRGLYLLCEKVKRDDDRVDIAKLDADDLAGDSLTGGYILKIDWLDAPQGFESNYHSQGGIPMFFQWYYPKATNIKPAQEQYISGWMNTFEDALFDPNYTNSANIRYTQYIDLNSFTDFLLINEFSKNSDGYKLSSYVYKDRDKNDPRLHAGPIWDFDQTYGKSRVCSDHDPTGWLYLQNQSECEDLESMPMWWQAMMADEVFQHRLKCRWTQFRQTFLHEDSIFTWIDDDTTRLSAAIARNYTQYTDILGEPIWAEPEPIPQTYPEEVAYMKSWITNRLAWLDANMPGDCAQDVTTLPDLKSPIQPLLIFPNPASTLLFIEGPSLLSGYTVFNSHGQVLYTGRNTQIDISKWSNGLYILKTKDGAYKVVVNH